MVAFNQFGPSPLDFFVYCFTHTTVWTNCRQIKEELLLHIPGVIASYGGKIAFPTRTLHVMGDVQPTGLPTENG
jgi:MscS family membrane protein